MKKSWLLAIVFALLFSTFSSGCFVVGRRHRRCYRNRAGRRVCRGRRHHRRGHHKRRYKRHH